MVLKYLVTINRSGRFLNYNGRSSWQKEAILFSTSDWKVSLPSLFVFSQVWTKTLLNKIEWSMIACIIIQFNVIKA